LVAQAVEGFSDQTASALISHTNNIHPTTSQPSHYPGGAVGDFNRDGWPDIYLIGGGGPGGADALYINQQDGTFVEESASWGLGESHTGHAAACGDFNGDGWPDMFVTTGGSNSGGGERAGQNMLLKNNGDNTFTDIAVSAGVNQSSATEMRSVSPAFGDYDLDGDLDLMVLSWGDPAMGNDGNRLYRNNGDETFTDVTDAAGIVQNLRGFVPRFVDMNGDRWPELLLVADAFTSRYYVNNQDGTFTDQTGTAGTGLDTNGMGSTIIDFDRNGLPDWYVTSIYRENPIPNHGNFLYVNQGNDVFVPLPETNGAKDGGWGWGTEAIDYNHDGWQDLVETNGIGCCEWVGEQAYLYRNNGDTTFTEVAVSLGLIHNYEGRAIMTLDYDRDGDMDVMITAYEDPVVLLRNDLSGTDINWVQINLDTSLNDGLAPDGVGSRIIVTAGGATQYFWLVGGNSYVGQSQLVAHFGLAGATIIDSITVEWSDGTTTVLNDQAVNQIMTIAAPAGGPDTPGEASEGASNQLQASYNDGTGLVDVTYTAACESTDHTVYYGDIDTLPAYAGAVCSIGTTGSVSFDPGSGATFFVVVGNDGAIEGPYGATLIDGVPGLRPEDTGTPGCDIPQDLSGTCTLP
jgi:hypothetical protein